MEITKIKGNTYYIKGGTNTGLYIFENNSALMIDPGLNGTRPKRIIEELESNKIALEYIINTHEHNDHYGGCDSFKSHYNELEILSSSNAKMYIENPELFSKYIMGGRSNDFFEKHLLKDKTSDYIYIDRILNNGKVKINNLEFEIIDLPGHTPGSIGIITEDSVIFVGDVLVSDKILKKYDFLFIYDIQEYIKSLELLREIEYEYLILGHGKEILSKEDSLILIEKHEQAIEKYLNQTETLLTNPMTLENLLRELIKNNKLSYNYKEYHYLKSSLVSVISYLADEDKISYKLEDGQLLYYTKKK